VADQCAVDLASAKLAAAIGVQNSAGDVTAPRDGHLELDNDQACLHAFVDRPADGPVREHMSLTAQA